MSRKFSVRRSLVSGIFATDFPIERQSLSFGVTVRHFFSDLTGAFPALILLLFVQFRMSDPLNPGILDLSITKYLDNTLYEGLFPPS